MASTKLFLAWILLFSFTIACSNSRQGEKSATDSEFEKNTGRAIPAAELTCSYFPLLKGKRIALVGNHTSLIGEVHLVDSLQNAGFQVEKVFSPEHGFRGTAPDGAKVESGFDERSGVMVISLYGARRRPTQDELAGIDLILVDMQDVGARFYTYISTMTYVMQEAARAGIHVVVLDRPNPNGHFVDGPILDPSFSSFVGMHPVPVVHGMTIGEFALMINGEGWLGGDLEADLKVIPVANYSRSDFYKLPVPPSPNLPNMRAVYLYPSLCFFEGTAISVGRGTVYPFQIFGSPELPKEKFGFTFTPQSVPASVNPPLLNQTCFGRDLRTIPIESLQAKRQINLSYLLDAYRNFPYKDRFFNNFFDRLAGSNILRNQIKAGLNEDQIRQSWQPGLEAFKKIRAKYLIYPDFE